MTVSRAEEPAYRVELSVEEVATAIRLIGHQPPPFLRDAEIDPDSPTARRVAQRSLVARGLVRVDRTGGASISTGLADMLEPIVNSSALMRTRKWNSDNDITVWYCPGPDRLARCSISPLGVCEVIDLSSDDFAVVLASDMGLRSGRTHAPVVSGEMTLRDYQKLMDHIAKSEASEATVILVRAGADSTTAEGLAHALVAAPATGNFSVIRPVDQRASAVEFGNIGWLDGGDAGLILIDGLSASDIRGGASGDESITLAAVTDERLLQEALGLMAPTSG